MGASPRLPQDVLHRFGVLRDHRQQHAGGRVRVRPALLPVSQRRRRQAEPGRELRLAESHLPPDLANIHLRHVDQRYANVIVLSLGPRDRLLQSLDNALADGLALSRARRLLRGR